MIVAVTYENGMVFQHFGHTAQFKLYMVENNAVQESRLLPTGASGHGALASLLQAAGVNTLICGGIGAGAKEAGLLSTPALPAMRIKACRRCFRVLCILCRIYSAAITTKTGTPAGRISTAAEETIERRAGGKRAAAFRVSSVLAENQRVGTIEAPRRGETAHVS